MAEVVVGGCGRSFGGGLREVIGNHLILRYSLVHFESLLVS